MKPELSEETWRDLRREARRAADEARGQAAERYAQEAMQHADVQLLTQLEQRLKLLGETWEIQRRPLVTRVPILGPLLAWIGSRGLRFFLQHQIALNAEMTRTLQDLYQVQKLYVREQIARTDDLFARLDERVLALEARLRDLEEEVERLRQSS